MQRHCVDAGYCVGCQCLPLLPPLNVDTYAAIDVAMGVAGGCNANELHTMQSLQVQVELHSGAQNDFVRYL